MDPGAGGEKLLSAGRKEDGRDMEGGEKVIISHVMHSLGPGAGLGRLSLDHPKTLLSLSHDSWKENRCAERTTTEAEFPIVIVAIPRASEGDPSPELFPQS